MKTPTNFENYQVHIQVIITYEAKLKAAKTKKNRDYANSILYSAYCVMMQAKAAYEAEYLAFMASN
jgi:hypothetical protein